MKLFKEPLYSQAYIDTGNGHPVVLLHGMFGNLAMWRNAINALRPHYRVLVPRLPLYDVPIHRANLPYLSEILNEFLEWRQLTDVTLIGTDIGGQLALDFSSRFKSKIRKVVISGCSGLFENLPLLDRDYDKDYNAVEDMVKDAFFRKDIVGTTVVNQVYNTVNTFSKGLHISAFAKASKENELANFLHKLTAPTLIVWGLQDRITPPEVALHFHDLLKVGTVKFINECGHLPMVEQPERYNTAVLDFLNQ